MKNATWYLSCKSQTLIERLLHLFMRSRNDINFVLVFVCFEGIVMQL